MYKKFLLVLLTMCLVTCSDSPTELSNSQDLSLATLKKVDDYPLYVMHYFGDYGFNSFLLEGLQTLNLIKSNDTHWACTCFASLNPNGDVISGRNFDWYEHPALLLFTDPPDGYASVSMVDISYLGFDRTGINEENRERLLEAPFLPFDGMNEKGVTVGMMAVPHAEGGNDTDKVTIGSLHVIRLVLDYAKDVEEAISLLQNYNVDFQGGPPVHYLIADVSGNSVVIEYIDHEIHVLRPSDHWQVSTNFIISGKTHEEAMFSCWRYNRAYTSLQNWDGEISQDQAMSILSTVSQSNTIWSVVYNATNMNIEVAMDRDYNEIHEFELEN